MKLYKFASILLLLPLFACGNPEVGKAGDVCIADEDCEEGLECHNSECEAHEEGASE